ncbi:MAG: hypothetical protein Q7S87_10025 [Agitococcus sp.]|nr:hypothetical protein [Agitococcus sp.]MDO9179331.1 hypothetical protein [Agitococcus sp.]
MDAKKRTPSHSEILSRIGLLVLAASALVLGISQAQTALLEISVQDYRSLQKIAVLSLKGQEHLRGWVLDGPISNQEYNAKHKILSDDARLLPLREEKVSLSEVKREIVQMSHATTK